MGRRRPGRLARRGIAALRPVELLTLRDRVAAELRYFGTATAWDPPAADRAEMRAIARRVGAALRDEVGFRGSFSIDGVMTEDGFRPTELNPRFAAGLIRMGGSCPELPLYFIDAAMCAGESWDFRLAELEALLVSGADAKRAPVANAWSPGRRSEIETMHLAAEAGGGYRRAGGGENADATVLSGPSPLGSFHQLRFDPAGVTIGRPLAPRLLDALACCDRELGTGFGDLEATAEVR